MAKVAGLPARLTSDRVPAPCGLKGYMNKISILLITMMLSATATADITGLVIPTAPMGGYSGGGSTAFSAQGFYGASTGGFDNHWVLTVDGATPGLTFTVENAFNPGNGAGAVGFSLVTVTGPGVPGVALTREATVCDPQGFSCLQRLASTFAASAGTYDLHIVGGGAFQWQYNMTATVVPEPGTAALAGAGLLMLMIRMSRRRTDRVPVVRSNRGSGIPPHPHTVAIKRIFAALLLAAPLAPARADGLAVVSEHSFTVLHLEFQFCYYLTGCSPVMNDQSASGAFAGVDRNGDGALLLNELTAFHADWGLLDGAQRFHYSPSTGLAVDARSFDGRTFMYTGRSLGYANAFTSSVWSWTPQTAIVVTPAAVVPEPATRLLWIGAGAAFLAFRRKWPSRRSALATK